MTATDYFVLHALKVLLTVLVNFFVLKFSGFIRFVFFLSLSLNFEIRKMPPGNIVSLKKSPHRKNVYPIFCIPKMHPKNKSITFKKIHFHHK